MRIQLRGAAGLGRALATRIPNGEGVRDIAGPSRVSCNAELDSRPGTAASEVLVDGTGTRKQDVRQEDAEEHDDDEDGERSGESRAGVHISREDRSAREGHGRHESVKESQRCWTQKNGGRMSLKANEDPDQNERELQGQDRPCRIRSATHQLSV